MQELKRLQNDFRTKKSHAFKFVNPGNTGKELYYKGRSDYKGLLIELLIATSDKLKALGVNVRVELDGNKKAA